MYMTIAGDVNNDGEFNLGDTVYYARHLINSDIYPIIDYFPTPKMNPLDQDPSLNLGDLVYLRRSLINSDLYPLSTREPPGAFSMQKVDGSDEAELTFDTSRISSTDGMTGAVSGVQLYIKGINLSKHTNPVAGQLDSYYTTMPGWIVAANTISAADNLSIVYLEKDTGSAISNTDPVVTLRFNYDTIQTNVYPTKTSGSYTSMVVDVDSNNQIVEYTDLI